MDSFARKNETSFVAVQKWYSYVCGSNVETSSHCENHNELVWKIHNQSSIVPVWKTLWCTSELFRLTMIETDLSLVSIIVVSQPVLLQKICGDHCSTQSLHLHQQWCLQIICIDQRNTKISVFYQQSMDLKLAAKTYIRTHKITCNTKAQKNIEFRSVVVHCHSRSILALGLIVCFCQHFQRHIDCVIRFTYRLCGSYWRSRSLWISTRSIANCTSYRNSLVIRRWKSIKSKWYENDEL